jgi:hypothetical protein
MGASLEHDPWSRSSAWAASLATQSWNRQSRKRWCWAGTDEAAIRHLLMSDGLQHAAATTVEIGVLAAYERPLPTMAEYNQLLTIEVPA